MTVLLPRIGVTYPDKGESLLTHRPEQFIGAFLVPGGYGFEEFNPPAGWIDTVLSYHNDPTEKDESSQELLDMIKNREVGADSHNSKDGMYLLFWIGVLASPQSPCDIHFCIQHTRLFELNLLLKKQIEHDIPTHTEVMSFDSFQTNQRPDLPKDLGLWKPEAWNEFCHHNFADNGNKMFDRWLAKTALVRNAS